MYPFTGLDTVEIEAAKRKFVTEGLILPVVCYLIRSCKRISPDISC